MYKLREAGSYAAEWCGPAAGAPPGGAAERAVGEDDAAAAAADDEQRRVAADASRDDRLSLRIVIAAVAQRRLPREVQAG